MTPDKFRAQIADLTARSLTTVHRIIERLKEHLNSGPNGDMP